MTGRFALKHFCGGFLAGKMTTWSLNRDTEDFFLLERVHWTCKRFATRRGVLGKESGLEMCGKKYSKG